MLKKLFFFILFLWGSISLKAGTFPDVSTPDRTVWYLIQFLNGGNVLEAQTSGSKVRTAVMTGSDAQLWKIESVAENTYRLTSKTNLVLYVDQAAKNGMFYAGENVSSNEQLRIVETGNASYTGGFEIQPSTNSAVSMNQFGGAGTGKDLGLWDKNDPNNPLKFVSLAEYESIGKYAIIPYPTSLKELGEGKLKLADLTGVTYVQEETGNVQKTVTAFSEQLRQVAGISWTVEESTGMDETGKINLILDETLSEKPEAYRLTIQADRIVIRAAAPAGFFYAVQTLKQLLPRSVYGDVADQEALWELPLLDIEDQPNLGHRGFMLDVARHFFSKEEVKRILDLMATYKMNLFHWHLTDDQGWRIEIPEYPLLTEVGSIRSGSFVSPGDGSGKFFDDTEYGRGMWYSQEDLKEIVAYAQDLHIDILPELDLPGHMVAAVTAYPELSCDSTKRYSVRLDSGISKDVLNVGDDKVIDFLKCVLDNLAGIFPYPYIHIGGDECPVDQWRTNELCLKRVQEEGLTGVEQLQSWLVQELGSYLEEKHQKGIVVWDELLSHWNDNNTVKPVIMAWNGLGKMSEAANRGFKSIATPHSNLYLDMMQVWPGQALLDEPYFGGWSEDKVVSLETVYQVNPLSTLSGKESYCLGMQANMWTETTNDSLELEYQLLPRLLAAAEVAWLPNSDKDWTSFLKRLQTHDDLFEAMGLNYATHYFEPEQLSEEEMLMEQAEQILAEAVRGAVGYPDAALHDALASALHAAKEEATEETIATLRSALEQYQAGPIKMPEPGKVYQLVSASVYYKQQYEGSTMYDAGGQVRFHYTPQTEPEELWSFDATDGGFLMKNYANGLFLQMPAYDAAVALGEDQATAVRIDRAALANGTYTYVPGALLISAVDGYTPEATGNVRRLTATGSGVVKAKNEPKLGSASTWKLVEVTDFRAQLSGLNRKCRLILETPLYGDYGEPSEEALTFLKEKVVLPVEDVLQQAAPISEELYRQYVALYNEYKAMPRKSLLDAISEEYYYQIQNAYFTDKYACAGTTDVVPANLNNTNDGFLWNFVKKDNKVLIYSKKTGKTAYINTSAEGQTIKADGQNDAFLWTLEQLTTDQSASGIAIVDGSGTYSWYTNPSVFSTILTKPKDWGASIWKLIKTNIKVITTGVEQITDNPKQVVYYDLTGRQVEHPVKGIYLTNTNKKVIMP